MFTNQESISKVNESFNKTVNQLINFYYLCIVRLGTINKFLQNPKRVRCPNPPESLGFLLYERNI